MDWLLLTGCAIVGYLIGGISSARLVARRVIPGKDISKVEHPVPGADRVFSMDTISATTMRTHAGVRYGCLTAVMDMLKVAVPMVLIQQLAPGVPGHLVFGTAAVAGHNWPVFHRFKGGRGESPMIGGFVVIDWLGVVVTNAAGSLGGVVLGSLLVMRWSWMFLMIAWLWWRTGDPWQVGYAVSVVGLYFFALRAELAQYLRLKLDRKYPSQEAVADILTMGKSMGRMMDRYSLLALYHRLRKPAGPAGPSA